LISNTLHASEVNTTLITTFEDTPNRQKIAVPIGLQILNQVQLVEVASVELVEEIINQQVTKG
jgi:hypothetical protein